MGYRALAPVVRAGRSLSKGGRREREVPAAAWSSRKHMGADKPWHNRAAPKNRTWLGQRKLC